MFVAFGNPLTDITVEIDDDGVLEKYGLKEDDQAELPLEKFEALLKEVTSCRQGGHLRGPGGSACNSARLLAALAVKRVALVGGTAGDEIAEALRRDRVATGLQDYPEMTPGRCVCLVRGAHRSLVANIGAAGHFDVDYLINTPELQEMLNSAFMIHVEGFFLSNRFPTCQYLVDEVQRKRGKPLCYNLAAPYVIQDLGYESKFMAENADLVFGNDKEFSALGAMYGLNDGVECAKMLHKIWSDDKADDMDRVGSESGEFQGIGEGPRRMGRFGKIVVVTNNCNPVCVVWGTTSLQFKKYDVPYLPSDKIVDTTGAGDAFIAGFVYGLMKSCHIDVCVRFACRLASMVIGYYGVYPPPGCKMPSIED